MLNQPYDKNTKILMKRVFHNFSEKEKRNYASIEAIKLGHGGIKYISELFGLSTKTISSGISELKKTTFVPLGGHAEKVAGANGQNKKKTPG